MAEAGWNEFNVAMAGVGAALAGLIIVAMSVNLEPIIKAKTLPSRAAASIATLVLAVAAACLGLMPNQPIWILGLEVLIGAIVVWVIEGRAALLIVRAPDVPGYRIFKVAVGVLPLTLITLGAVLLVASVGSGFTFVALGSVLAVAGAVLFAWVALIEILR